MGVTQPSYPALAAKFGAGKKDSIDLGSSTPGDPDSMTPRRYDIRIHPPTRGKSLSIPVKLVSPEM